jgi:SAM-dependent methyltransferase
MALQYPFDIYRELTGNDYFHFGLWVEGTDSIEEAQDNLAECLLERIPETGLKILEVGCGLGKLASLMAARGHRVLGIDIDAEKIAYAIENYSSKRVSFAAGDFFAATEGLEKETFDFVVFSESSQYFEDLRRVLGRSRALLAEKGGILLCDEMVNTPEVKDNTAVKLKDDYICAFYENGFRIVEQVDLSEKIRPTCTFMVERLSALGDRTGVRELLDGWAFQQAMYEKGSFGYFLMMAAKDDYFLACYGDGMESQIVPLFNEVFGVSRSNAHWEWKYRFNPFGKSAVVVAKDTNGDIIGHYSGYYVPWLSQTDGKVYNVIQGVDTFTIKRVRRVGLGKTGLFARLGHYFFASYCNHRMPFAYGVNTAAAYELGKRYLGYRPIEPVGYYILDSASLHKGGLIRRLYLRGYHIYEIDWFGDGFDLLFESSVKDYPPLIVHRDSAYLNWRFSDPDKQYVKIAINHGKSLVGYAVAEVGKDSLTIGDLFVKKEHVACLRKLLEFLGRNYGPCRMDLWLASKPEWLTDFLRETGFSRGESPFGLTMIYLRLSEKYDDSLMGNLFYTKSDTDLF